MIFIFFHSFSFELFTNFNPNTYRHIPKHRSLKWENTLEPISEYVLPVYISQTTNGRVFWNPDSYFCASWFHSKHSLPLCPIMFNVRIRIRIQNDMLGCVSVMANQKWKPENRIHVADIIILVKFIAKYPFLNSSIRIVFAIWFECMKFPRQQNTELELMPKFRIPFQVFICYWCWHWKCSILTKFGHKCALWILDWRF